MVDPKLKIDEYIAKIEEINTEMMNNNIDNLMDVGFRRFKKLEAICNSARHHPDKQINMINAMNEALGYMQEAREAQKEGNLVDAFRYLKDAIAVIDEWIPQAYGEYP